jgi:hypothetical protein
VASSCEHGREPPVSINGGEYSALTNVCDNFNCYRISQCLKTVQP